MNPQSPATYYRRHKRRAVLLMALISFVTAGVDLMGALLSSTFETGRSNFMFLSKFSIVNPELYNNILTPLEVVGIVESDIRLGVVSLEYLTKHEYYREFADLFLVVAKEDRESAVDNFLRSEIQTPRTSVHTLQKLNEEVKQEYLEAFGVLAPSIIIVVIVFALVIATANWVAYSRRLAEFGILYAVGYSRKFLIRRLTMETTTLALLSWGLGIGISWLILFILNVILFIPRGQDLSIFLLGAVGLTIPLPVSVIGFTYISIRGIISHLDPITIVESGELSQEMNQKRDMTRTKSLPKPLVSITFYRRHKRRALLLISVMSMMIV